MIGIGWLPGPGGVTGILGLAVLGAELKPLATFLDITETKSRKFWDVLDKRWRNGGVALRAMAVLPCLTLLSTGAWLAAGIVMT